MPFLVLSGDFVSAFFYKGLWFFLESVGGRCFFDIIQKEGVFLTFVISLIFDKKLYLFISSSFHSILWDKFLYSGTCKVILKSAMSGIKM